VWRLLLHIKTKKKNEGWHGSCLTHGGGSLVEAARTVWQPCDGCQMTTSAAATRRPPLWRLHKLLFFVSFSFL